jgi:hypothetical protein
MPSTANVQIHINTTGDVNLDQVYNLKENPSSVAMVFTQLVGGNPGGGIVIFNPFPLPGYVLGGLLIVPPRDNVYAWGTSFGPFAANVLYHPAAPVWLAFQDVPLQPEIYHMGPPTTMVPFTFIWI